MACLEWVDVQGRARQEENLKPLILTASRLFPAFPAVVSYRGSAPVRLEWPVKAKIGRYLPNNTS